MYDNLTFVNNVADSLLKSFGGVVTNCGYVVTRICNEVIDLFIVIFLVGDNNSIAFAINALLFYNLFLIFIVVPCIMITFKILFTNKCTLY